MRVEQTDDDGSERLVDENGRPLTKIVAPTEERAEELADMYSLNYKNWFFEKFVSRNRDPEDSNLLWELDDEDSGDLSGFQGITNTLD